MAHAQSAAGAGGVSSFGRWFEPPGPASRRTDLVISEIMYHPPDRVGNADGHNLGFVELYNSGLFPEDIGSYRLSGDIACAFPPNTIIQPGEYILIADSPISIADAYGITNAFNYSGNLGEDHGTVRLRNRADAILLEVNYEKELPWPALAGGKGRSLVLAQPSYGQSDPRAWDVSEQFGGTPGRGETLVTNALRLVSINEFLANAAPPDADFIELYNKSAQDVDISGCTLSDNPTTNKFIFVGARIAAGSYLALDEVSLGFKMNAEGDTIYFRDPSGEIIDAIRFGPQAREISMGRVPEGGTALFPLFPPTPYDQNDTLYSGDIIINEIMFAPISGKGEDEYVELFNRTTNWVNVGGWAVAGGIDFTIPAGIAIPPQGYLVLARDAASIIAHYPQLNSGNTLGNYDGSLADEGERITLVRPEPLVDGGVTNVILVTEDEVDLRPVQEWGHWSHGGGSSLELMNVRSENRFARNWEDSDESQKAPWTTIQFTGEIQAASAANDLQIMLMGEGECLVDQVEVVPGGGNNFFSAFDAGMAGWAPGGNHIHSCLEMNGFPPNQPALHLRASGSGDTTINHVRARLSAPLPPGQVTLSARAKWARGNPILVMRLSGQTFEASGKLTVPENLGTPGLPNSRARPNIWPVIADVKINPILPAAGQPVLATARVSDSDGLGAVVLSYRLDPSFSYQEVPMRDDGTGGDVLANDGVFSAIIPGQPEGTLVAFSIAATDAAKPPAGSVFPAGAPTAECLVRFGEGAAESTIASLRIWMTSSNLELWSQRSRFSDEPIDCTLVYGNARVIFNAGLRYGGDVLERNTYASPTNGLVSFVVSLDHDKLLESQTLNLEAFDPLRDPTLLRNRVTRWMAEQIGIPAPFERFLHVSLNGAFETNRGASVFVDRQSLDADFLKQWYPDDSEGELRRIQPWAELDAQTHSHLSLIREATLEDAGAALPRQKGAYRWNWNRVPGKDFDDTFLDLFGMAAAFNAPDSTYHNYLEGCLNVDEWLRALALGHAAGAWQTYGYDLGRNGSIYKPAHSSWLLLPGPMSDSLGGSGGVEPDEDPFLTLQPEVARFLNDYELSRRFLRTLQTVANLALDGSRIESEVVGPMADALQSAGFPVNLEANSELLAWVDSRREYLISLMPANFFEVLSIDISTSNGLAAVSGVASAGVSTFLLNYQATPVVWTSPSNWTAQIVVAPGAGQILVTALASDAGDLGPGTWVSYTNAAPAVNLSDSIVISEIKDGTESPGTGFLEIYNGSGNYLDLGGFKLLEEAFSFPSPTLIAPNGYLVLAEERSAFTAAYGTGVPILGELATPLDPQGTTITLWRPSPAGDVDKVKFEAKAPWPIMAGTSNSLQLMDARQDNSRVGNWSASFAPTPGRSNTASASLGDLAPLFLNEIQSRNNGSFPDNTGQADPWIEIYNSGTNNIVLSGGYYVTDSYSNLTRWAFPAGTSIGPRQYLLIWADGETEQSVSSSPHTNFRLNEGGGSLALAQAGASGPVVLDYVNYPAMPMAATYGSFPNGQIFSREVLASATPGALNRAPAIFINEWMASNDSYFDPADGDADDWFELYNATSQPRDISGYGLADDQLNPPYVIPQGTTIAPHGYLLVWADGETFQNTTNRPNLHVPFNLGAKGDAITLTAPDRSVVDTITFLRQTNRISQGRWPDGSPNIRYMPQPTPGASNFVANTPPFIAAISNRLITVGQTLNIPIVASDSDTPAASLAISLQPGAPAGAAIANLTNFFWAPTAGQAPSTNTIVVQAVDDAIPPLTSTRSFQVIVALPPQATLMRAQPGLASLTFQAIAGKTYMVQYKNRLQDPLWTTLGNPITNLNTSVTIPMSVTTNSQRFFRVGIMN